MKTDRRQDLRTNELSQQIEQISDYVKKNATWLTIIVVVAAVVVGGSYWYIHYHEQQRLDGWARVSTAAATAESPSSSITVFESVARQDLSPGLTAQAFLEIGSTAMTSYTEPPKTAEATTSAPAETPAEWAARAKDAYTQIVNRFPNDVTAAGVAMINLGVLSEDQKQIDAARGWYKRLVDSKEFESTPFRVVANHRLAGLDRWSSPIAFLPPTPTVPQPGAQPLTGSPPFGSMPLGSPPPGAKVTPLQTGATPGAVPAGAPPIAPPGATPPPAGAPTPPPAGTTPPGAPAGAAPTATPPAPPAENAPAANPPAANPPAPQNPAPSSPGQSPANPG